MRFSPQSIVRIASIVLIGLAGASSAFPQEPSIEAAAAKTADAIAAANKQDVMVFDFFGPDAKITPLGQKLADEFSGALSKSAVKLQVEDRSQIPSALKANSYPLDFVDWGSDAHAFAQDIHVQSFVMGEMTVEGDQVNVVISSYRSDTGKNINSVRIAQAMSADDKKMIDSNLAAAAIPEDLAGMPNGGKNGYSTPGCLYCPRADYTRESESRKIQGMVELIAVVDADGTIHDIRVIKPLPYGLTDAAVRAVSKWKLKPATGPDGKPAAVRQIIEVTFQLY